MKKIRLTELLIFIVSAELVGALSALFAGGNFSVYDSIIKPPLSPPAIVFPVVWTVLYALMGISVYFIYTSGSEKSQRKRSYTIYIVQLLFNFLWSIVFFRFKAFTLSSVVIIILLISIILMILNFYKVRKISAYLNIPYILWVLFAAYLNIATAILN